jgi:SARP family transcriptional regulator, regulator of embCAB operon
MKIRLLGPTTIVGEAVTMRLGAPKQRQVLALLALRAGKVVSIDDITEELWGAAPPRSASTAIQTYVCQLRKVLRNCFPDLPEKHMLATVDPGYVLRVQQESVDVFRFRESMDRARRLSSTATTEALTTLSGALDMLSGPPLADVRRGIVLQGDGAHVDDELMAAHQLKIHLEMRLGRYGAVIAHLRPLIVAYPFVESFQISLMESLYRVGRRRDAIRAYHQLRSRIQDELGVDPSQDAKNLYSEIISFDGDRTGAWDLRCG